MPDFFQTRMGQTFFEGTMPRIARSLVDIATELKRQNDLKEQELHTEAIKEAEKSSETAGNS